MVLFFLSMSMLSHSMFLEQCRAQGVALFGDLADPNQPGYEASECFGAFRHGEALSSGPIPDTTFCVDAISMAHARIIDSTHGVEPVTTDLLAKQSDIPLSGCRDAERRFGEWLSDLEADKKVGGSIIVDENGGAVAINKRLTGCIDHTYGEGSSILLQDVKLKRGTRTFALPRGALVYIERPYLDRRDPRRMELTDPEIVPFGQILGICFARMTGIDLDSCDWRDYYSNYGRRPSMMYSQAINDVVSRAIERQNCSSLTLHLP